MNLLNSSATGGNQFVTFSIANEEYGIEIKSVQEIVGHRTLTYLPNSPRFVKGILNLRGNVIPVMDPRIKFSMQEVEYDKTSVIIIVKANQKNVGIIVDQIKDVLTIESNHIEDAPELSDRIDSKFINGIGKVGEKFVIILDVNKIFSHEDAQQLAA
ncbi:MAG: purine-binding chemotaxis protein CheW [Oligoflexia bacterium]|nr:purine-binding chemotaxis protein CheW [Oligoflexia bacterium]MBF0364338.1 purine-binding chemotaxis protein CheW [Oligoflexia bacterium]